MVRGFEQAAGTRRRVLQLVVAIAVVFLTVTLPATAHASSVDTSAYTVVTAGDSFTVALKSDGTVWAWGSNSKGQLGQGTTTNSSSPVQVLTGAGAALTDVKSVVAGDFHVVALKSNGTVYAWGDDRQGQVGVGSTAGPNTCGGSACSWYATKVKVSGGAGADFSGVVAVAAGGQNVANATCAAPPCGHSLALKADGTVWAWGFNGDGELGDNSTTTRTNPVQAYDSGTNNPIVNAIAIAGGGTSSLALKADGTVWGWGRNANGELCQGNTTATSFALKLKLSAVNASFDNVKAIAAGPGSADAYMLRSDGTVWGCGNDANGEIGDNGAGNQQYPVQAATDATNTNKLNNVIAIAAGGNASGGHAQALRADGSIWAWGYDGNGQLAQGNTTTNKYAIQMKTAAATNVANATLIATGSNFTAALTAGGTFIAAGLNSSGELGNGGNAQATYSTTGTFTRLSASGPWIASAGGFGHTLLLKADGTVWGLGRNNARQLGTVAVSASPVLVQAGAGVITNIKAIATTWDTAVVLRADGTVWTWGVGDNGELGNGTTVANTATPQQVVKAGSVALTNVIAVSAAWKSAAALASDNGAAPAGSGGTVWDWGQNTQGQLGNNTNTTTAGSTCAATFTCSNYAVQVLTPTGYLTNVKSMSMGGYHALALRTDGGAAPAGSGGTAWGWGQGTEGENGDGTTNNSWTVTQVKKDAANFLLNVTHVYAGNLHSVLRTADSPQAGTGGAAYGFGYASCYRVGDGQSTTNRLYPVQVQSGAATFVNNTMSIGSGNDTADAEMPDGTMQRWGCGAKGENASNAFADSQYAGTAQVQGGGSLTSISSGTGSQDHLLVLRTDGNVWGSGYNPNGELGDCSIMNRSYAVLLRLTCLAVAGNVYVGEGAAQTVWSGCNGSTKNISISVDGESRRSGTCDPTTGAFSIWGGWNAGTSSVLIWIDNNAAGNDGAIYVRPADGTSDLTGLTLVKDRVWVQSKSASTINNADIALFDLGRDTDIPVDATGSTDLVVSSGTELHVANASTFTAPTATATIPNIDLAGTFSAASSLSLVLTGSGTGACDQGPGVAPPLCISGTGGFALPGSTSFRGTADSYVEAGTYGSLLFEPASGTPTYSLGRAASASIAATTLTVGTGTSTVTASTSAFSPNVSVSSALNVNASATLSGNGTGTITVGAAMGGNGTVALTGGTVDQSTATGMRTLGPTANNDWSFNNLTFSHPNLSLLYGGGTGAATYTSAGANADVGYTMATDLAGNTYVAGSGNVSGVDTQWVIAKYDQTGALVSGWGSSGLATYNPTAGADFAKALAVDGDGSIYVAGTSSAGSNDWVVRKYAPGGTLDTTWNAGGAVPGMQTYDSGGVDDARGIAIDATGRSWVSGQVGLNGGDIALRRYKADGTLDTSWNAGGAVPGMQTYNSGAANVDRGRAVAVDAAGSAYVVGEVAANGFDWIALKYTASGTLDTTWNAAGTVPGTQTYNSAASNLDVANAVAVDPLGALYVAGYTGGAGHDWAIRKYAPAGTLDTAWNAGGAVPGMQTYASAGSNVDEANAIAVTDAGVAYVAGTEGAAYDWAVRRYAANGTLDTAWATSGMSSWSTGTTANSQPYALGLDAGGAIFVAGGGNTTPTGDDMTVRKLQPNGTSCGACRTVSTTRINPGGTAVVHVNGTMQVGKAGDTGATLLEDETADRAIDANGDVTITTMGALQTSSTASFTVAGNFTNNNRLAPDAGTITVDDGAKASTIAFANATSFYGLAVTAPSETARFDHLHRTNVSGTFTVSGAACATRVRLRSDLDGSRVAIAATGASSVGYADLQDVGVTSAAATVAADNSGDSGNNSGWTIAGGVCQAATMYTGDTAAQAGTANATGIVNVTPRFSWVNASGNQADAQRTKVMTTPIDNVLGLWHLDGNGTDVLGRQTLTRGAATAAPAYATGYTAGLAQDLSFDGNDTATIPSDAAYQTSVYTLEAWFKTSSIANASNPVILYRHALPQIHALIGFDRTANTMLFKATSGAGASTWTVSTTATPWVDGTWHHVAGVVDSGKQLHLYVDGVERGTPATYTGTLDTPAAPTDVGSDHAGCTCNAFVGQVDEVRMSGVARTAGEIAGYFHTALPHNLIMWDSDTSDTGVALAACANGARCADITYGATGSPAALIHEGARFYASAKFKPAAGPWSAWGSWDWFETHATVTLGFDATNVSLSPASIIAGQDAATTTAVSIATNNATGYTLTATDADDAWGLQQGANSVNDWTGNDAVPTVWGAGTSGCGTAPASCFGITVLGVTGATTTKDAKWGSGTTATDYVNNRYAGLKSTSSVQLHQRAGYYSGTDTITTAYRFDMAPGQPVATYSGGVTYAVNPNP